MHARSLLTGVRLTVCVLSDACARVRVLAKVGQRSSLVVRGASAGPAGCPHRQIGERTSTRTFPLSSKTLRTLTWLCDVQAAPHAFRGMQATDAHEAGIGGAEGKALAWGRQHSEATVAQFYAKPSHKRMAAMAESALAAMRGKRQKLVLAGDAYREVAEEDLDDE